MNWRRGFKRIALVLSIVGAIIGAILAGFIVYGEYSQTHVALRQKCIHCLFEYGLGAFTQDDPRAFPLDPTPAEIQHHVSELKRRIAELRAKTQLTTSELDELDAADTVD